MTPAIRAATTREPEVIPALAGPADERQLLADARPVGRDDVSPHVVGVPLEPAPYAVQLPRAVGEHLARGDLEDGLPGQRQPVPDGEVGRGVHAEPRHREIARRPDLHPVAHDRVPRRREPNRETRERVGQLLAEVRVDVADELTRDEEVEAQPPVVVARDRVVEAEDVGSAPEAGSGIRKPRPARLDARTHDLLEVGPRQLDSGQVHVPDRASRGPGRRMPPRPVGHDGIRQQVAGRAEVTNRARRAGAAAGSRRR